jgi:Secreted protein containing C-terminal beta-propeller domain distantly related to WD-40 repeats
VTPETTPAPIPGRTPPTGRRPTPDRASTGLDTFENESAFETYVRRGSRLAGSSGFGSPGFTDAAVERDVAGTPVAETAEGGQGGGDAGSLPSRVATTNVQVESLDEPDIVKTDGRHFYYAPDGRISGPRPLRADGVGLTTSSASSSAPTRRRTSSTPVGRATRRRSRISTRVAPSSGRTSGWSSSGAIGSRATT